MKSLLSHILFFLVISLVIALATSLIRLRNRSQIIRETLHFFVTIAVGVAIFCVIVYFLEWIFIRPLI